MRTRHAVALAAFTLVAVSACDRFGEIVLVPERELVDSFESGVGSWTVRTADLGAPPGSWSVEGTSDAASEGGRSLKLHLDNTSGAGKVWIVREVELSPDQDYDVEVAFDLGAAGDLPSPPWSLIAGSHATEPANPADLTFRDGATPDSTFGAPGYTFASRSYRTTVRATAAGTAVVIVGVWGTTAEERTYYLDNVRASFTRR